MLVRKQLMKICSCFRFYNANHQQQEQQQSVKYNDKFQRVQIENNNNATINTNIPSAVPEGNYSIQ